VQFQKYGATVKYYKDCLKIYHPSNIEEVKKLLKNAENKKGKTLFDII